MDPLPGLFSLSSTTASSGDRLSSSNIAAYKKANRSSGPKRRPASTTTYDPNVATKGWQIYSDPSEETESVGLAYRQQRGGKGHASRSPWRSTRAPDHSNDTYSDPQTQAQPQPATTIPHDHGNHQQEHHHHQPPSDLSSSSLGDHVKSAPNRASQKTAARVLRTLKQVLAEEKERQEVLGAGEDNGPFDAGADARRAATDDELIERLDIRYRQLTLQEEADRGVLGGERERRRRKRREHAEVEMEERAPGHGHGLGQANIQGRIQDTTEGQIRVMIKSDARLYESYIEDPVDVTAESTAASAPAVASTSVPVPLPTLIPIIGPATLSMAKSGIGTGAGLTFAERMRARKREKEPERTRARKRARQAEAGGRAGASYGDGGIITLNESLPGQSLLPGHRAMISSNSGVDTGVEAWAEAGAYYGVGDITASAAAAPSNDVSTYDLTMAMTGPDPMAQVQRHEIHTQPCISEETKKQGREGF